MLESLKKCFLMKNLIIKGCDNVFLISCYKSSVKTPSNFFVSFGYNFFLLGLTSVLCTTQRLFSQKTKILTMTDFKLCNHIFQVFFLFKMKNVYSILNENLKSSISFLLVKMLPHFTPDVFFYCTAC